MCDKLSQRSQDSVFSIEPKQPESDQLVKLTKNGKELPLPVTKDRSHNRPPMETKTVLVLSHEEGWFKKNQQLREPQMQQSKPGIFSGNAGFQEIQTFQHSSQKSMT